MNTIENYFLADYLVKAPNTLDQARIKITYQVSLIFGLTLGLVVPTIMMFGKLVFLGALFATLSSFFTPFLLKYTHNYRTASIFLLSNIFLSVVLTHHIILIPNLLGVGIWYLVIILAASFILDKNWSIGFSALAILNIFFVALSKTTGVYLFGIHTVTERIFLNSDKIMLAPLRIGLPIMAIYLIVSEFLRNKRRIETEIFGLLKVQNKLNKRLEKSEFRFRTLIEGVDDLIYTIDQNGIFTYVNPAVERISGFTRAEFMKMNFLDNVLKEYQKEHVAFYVNQIGEQIPITYREFPVYNKFGEIVWLGQKVSMSFNEKGAVTNSLCIARDITKERKIKEKLIEAKEKAIEASQIKAQFLSSMSHEIRTPMNAVIALIHLLQEEDPMEGQKEHLNTLRFSAENLLELINDILDFSKIEAGKVVLQQNDFSLRTIAESIQHGFGSKAKEKGINLELNFDEKLPEFIVGDALRITQILNNLVSNAVKFTDKGRVLVEILQKRVSEESLQIYFAISDSGIGIPEDKLDSIFEDFIQATENTIIRQGTGLGLSITKELLKLHKSTIKVESIYGQGSKFQFELCLKKSINPTGKPKNNQRLKKEVIAPKSIDGLKVLLAEDNVINQKVTLNFLNKWGVQSDIADNGLIAFEMVQQNDYDIILMDLQMPVMNGLESTKKIRGLAGKHLHLPIIALTASAIQEVKDESISSGLNDFISKPFTPDKLFAMLAKYAPTEKPRRATS